MLQVDKPKTPFTNRSTPVICVQGHYTANNPTIDLNPAFEVVTTTAQALAGEMLYRGVAITLLTQWLADRWEGC